MEMVITHKWQEQGLGQAPFKAIDLISLPSSEVCEKNPSAYNIAMESCQQSANVYGVTLGSCYACGMGLINNVVIRDANKKHFIVGCDCAAKTHDSRLVTAVEELERKRQKAIREAKYAQERQARQAKREAEEQAERDRNGGLTGWEVEAQKRKQAEESARQQATEQNRWLLDVLARVPYCSDFVMSMIRDLETRPADSLSDRCLQILGEIYAKTVSDSRKGSKAYKAAENEFWAHFGE